MQTIIESGSKQYKVKKGDIIEVELLPNKEGENISFDKVLMTEKDSDIKIGQPYVDGAKVTAKIISHGKDKKVVIFKYKNKTNYRRTKGHRQPLTRVQIEDINT